MITQADETLLRRAIAIAAQAITVGDAPYGSLLADADGTILIEAHNTVWSDNALATEQLITLNPGSRWPVVTQDGPALFDEARVPIEEFYRSR